MTSLKESVRTSLAAEEEETHVKYALITITSLLLIGTVGGVAECRAQEGPKDIIAAQIRSQGYACDSPQSAERDMAASKANEAVWMLRCQNASYRVTLIPNLAAQVEKVGD